ncbi:MAG: DUF2231 domain-containing protein [Rikenellaceae bacterium]
MFSTSHIHPMLVHFPIALAMLGFLFEVINQLFLKKKGKGIRCGEYILYFATISMIVTVLSGYIFTGTFTGITLEVRNSHVMFAVITTLLLILSSILYLLAYKYNEKANKMQQIGLLFYALAAIAVSITGSLGGTLVYGYMIGL